MKVFWSVEEVGDALQGGAIAIGNFDGVHKGHQALITHARELAKHALSGVLTFSPHPNQILKKHDMHFRLMTDQEKIAAFAKLGVDIAVLHKIDEAFLHVSADAFVEDVLIRKLRIKHVVVGDDFTFGNAARGDSRLLTERGHKLGFSTHIIDPVVVDNKRCSSTAIKEYLRKGHLLKANEMLGRPYSCEGIVVKGQQLGRTLGFKTANIMPPSGFPLAHGIYATIARIKSSMGHDDVVSATSVGSRPTVTEEKTVVIETHLLDRDVDLYGQEIRIFFVERLRGEEKFASHQELQTQIAQDCKDVWQLRRRNPTRFHVKD